MLAVLIAAENGDEKHRGAEVLRRRQVGVGAIVGEEPQLDVGEHEVGGALWNFASEQGHQHETPGDDGIDGDGALQPVGGVEGEMFGPASGFQNPKEILDAPAFQVIPDALDRRLEAVDVETGQQKPLDCPLTVRRCGFAHVDHRDRDRFGPLDGGRHNQLAIVDLGQRKALAARRADLLAA